MMKLRIFIAFLLTLLCPIFAQAQVGVTLTPVPRAQFLDVNGHPLSGGLVYTYISGTTTPQATYTDSTGTSQNTNPIVLDSAGEAQIWLAGGQVYTIVLKDQFGVQQWSVSGVTGSPTLLSPGPIGTTSPNVVEATAFISATSMPALTGLIRLASGDTICWRNTGNSADICIGENSSSSISVPALNNIVKVDKQTGATADLKMASCFSALPSGGICDATGFSASTQSIASTVTVPGGITLLFDADTKFQAAASNTNIFVLEPNAIVRGFHFDCGNQPSYTGNVFSNDTAQVYGDANTTSAEDITITCSGVTGGNALQLNSTGIGTGVDFTSFRHWRGFGLANGVLLTASNAGFVNGNHFTDMEFSKSTVGYSLSVTGANAATSVGGNLFSNVSYELSGGVGTNNGVELAVTTGHLAGNIFSPIAIWDTTTPINVATSGPGNNIFVGRWDGTLVDTQHTNFFFTAAGVTQSVSTINEGTTPPAGVAGQDICWGNIVIHAQACSYNNDAFTVVPRINGSVTAGHIATWADATHVQDGGPLPTVTRQALSGPQSILATTPTVVSGLGATVSIPTTGTYRIEVCYSVAWTTAATPEVDFWVSDGTNKWAAHRLTLATSGSNHGGAEYCEDSPTTYTNGVTPTVTLTLNTEGLNAYTITQFDSYSNVAGSMTEKVYASN